MNKDSAVQEKHDCICEAQSSPKSPVRGQILPSQDLNILRQALQNFVFLVSESDLEKCEDLFRFAKVFTKYFHIVHIVGCRVESCMIYRRVLVESTSHSIFILLEPKYRFRLQKGVKNEDENHFKILNTN